MNRKLNPPSSARILTHRVDAYAREHDLSPKRIRDWISYMILAGQLDQANASAGDGGPRFAIKGAVAIEMRLPTRARTTKDMDLVLDNMGEAGLVVALRAALETDYQGFNFRVKGEPYPMPNNTIRVDVALEYKGRSWGTIQVDLSGPEGGCTEMEHVEALRLEPFGLITPEDLPCLSVRYHIAQKIHAMTEPPLDDGTPNERFRDLVDLLLMRELVTDIGMVRVACEEVFAIRGTHAWPPMLQPPAFWEQPFAALAVEVDLGVLHLHDAVREARAFLTAIENAS